MRRSRISAALACAIVLGALAGCATTTESAGPTGSHIFQLRVGFTDDSIESLVVREGRSGRIERGGDVYVVTPTLSREMLGLVLLTVQRFAAGAETPAWEGTLVLPPDMAGPIEATPEERGEFAWVGIVGVRPPLRQGDQMGEDTSQG